MKLIGLTLGEPFSTGSRSGVNYNIFTRFQKKVDLVNVFDLDLKGIKKLLLAVKYVSLNRNKWGNKLHQNPQSFEIRTKMAENVLEKLASKYDLVYQDGAMFLPGRTASKPFVSYHDSNVVLSAQGGNYAHGAHYHGPQLKMAFDQEKQVYLRASIVFSMSDWLKKSFIRDFGISEEKIVTVYAGTNIDIDCNEKNDDGKTILFVGKNFYRKGGRTLLDAFKLVRREIHNARLIIIGPEIDIDQAGVEVKGLIMDKSELSRYFSKATVFAMPSEFEPFGIVFLEAFAHKTPCIGSAICAMPEIIEEGKGGFLVPPHDHRVLADRIIMLLKDRKLSTKMGLYGFSKVQEKFNWNTVVHRMIEHMMKII